MTAEKDQRITCMSARLSGVTPSRSRVAVQAADRVAAAAVFFNAGSVYQARGMAGHESVEIRPVQHGEHAQVLALASRLAEGVAAWRDPQAVLRAVSGWVESSLGTASEPGHVVYVAVADARVAGVVTVAEWRISLARWTPMSGRLRSRVA